MKFIFKIMSLLLVLGSFQTQAIAQKNEFGFLAGASNYHGDLAYNIAPNETRFSGSAFYRWNINSYWSMRPTLSYIPIGGADSNFAEYNDRNLSFRNNIYEVSNVMEFNFQPFSNRSIHNSNTFYVMGGIAGFIHKPEAKLDDQWYDLRKAQTENTDYRLIQLSIPMGAGYKQSIGGNFVFGLEAAWRLTFTDYLDDVSSVYPELETDNGGFNRLSDRSWQVSETGMPLANQGDTRGDANLRDWYFQTAVTIAYRFTPIKCAFDVRYFK